MRQLFLSRIYALIIHLWLIEMQTVKYFEPQKIFQGKERSKDEETLDFLSNELKNKTSYKRGKLTR